MVCLVDQNIRMPLQMKASLKKRKVTGAKGSRDDGDEDADQELEENFALIRKRHPGRRGQGEDQAEEHRQRCGEESVEDEDEDARGMSDDEEDVSVTDSDSVDGAGSGTETKELQTEDNIKRELSTMSFEEIMTLQNKVGMKVFNEVAYGTKNKQGMEKGKKRLNKNRPMEISAKKPAPFLRHVVPVKKKVLRDPRFDDLSGEYKPEIFEKTYSFINGIKQKEKEMVKKKIKKVKSGKKREQLEQLLKRMENQESAQKQREIQREKELEHKRRQRELAKQGHRPFFLKKSDKRKLELAEKYSTLKKSGKLENFLSKKRKRNAMKDRRKLALHQKDQ